MMFWYGGGWTWWQAGLMWLAMITFSGLLIWAVWALVTSAARKPGRSVSDEQRGSTAHGILDERLARGEIDIAQYHRLCEVLDTGSGHSTVGTMENTSAPPRTWSAR